MSLKLFRSTGYSSILVPGETRLAPHPGWIALAVGGWIGLACNVALWRALTAPALEPARLLQALSAGAMAGSAVAVVLCVLGWRRTVKPAASLALMLAAGLATGLWLQSLPLEAGLVQHDPAALFPSWAHLLTWQAPTLLAALSLPPLLWLWSTRFRRLSGPAQLQANLLGAALAGSVLAAAALARGLGTLAA